MLVVTFLNKGDAPSEFLGRLLLARHLTPEMTYTSKRLITMKASFSTDTRTAVPINTLTLPAGCPLPRFRMGERVLSTEDYNEKFTHRIIGTICGFEYLNHPEFESGWSYILAVEESAVVRPDGSLLRLIESGIETVPEHQIQHIHQKCFALVALAS